MQYGHTPTRFGLPAAMSFDPLASEPAIRTIAMPADTHPSGDIFCGGLMAHMALAACNLAARIAHGRAATIAVEGMTFVPIKEGPVRRPEAQRPIRSL